MLDNLGNFTDIQEIAGHDLIVYQELEFIFMLA